MTSVVDRLRDEHVSAAEYGVPLGGIVKSADGKRLGEVNEMRGPYFKVHRGLLASDYWLEVTDVVALVEDEVIVGFEKRAAGDHQVADDIVHDERLDARDDHLLDQDQVREQRERMERELHIR
jgi:hypothetical protein